MFKWWLSPLMDEEEEGEGSGGGKGKKAKAEKEESEESSEEGDEDEEESEESEEGDEDENEEEDENEDELDEAAVKEAKNLYKLIKNPASQKQAIEILARSAGIQIGEAPKNKEESKDIAKNTVAILEEALGENLKWLAPKLATALDKLRESDREANKKELDSLKAGQIEKEVDQAYAELRRETKGDSKKYENRMVGLADKLLPAAGMSVVEYVRHLYTIASAKGEGKSAKLRLAEKINKNSKDIPGRIRNSSSDGGGKGSKDSTPPMTALEAVRATAKKLGMG